MEKGECLSQGHGWNGVFLVPKHVFYEEFLNYLFIYVCMYV